MTAWHSLGVDQALHELGATPRGLAPADAAERLGEHGPNELIERPGRSLSRIVFEQLSSVLIVLLIVAAALSAALDDWQDAAAILAIVLLNAALGTRQEYKAEQAMAALKKLSAPHAKLRRDGHIIDVPSADVVPGDIMLIDAGTVIAADARLIESASLRVEEAALTGESAPVDKNAAPLHEAQAALAERSNMVFRATAAVYGRAVAVVTATGMRTELGRIAELIQEVEDEKTPLQKRLDHLGRVLVTAAVAIVAVVFALGILRGEPVRLMFLTAVSLAVAAAPEGLPAVVTIALALGARRMLRRDALIRRLPAVETLGSVTYICSDKTGTLTQNRMRVTRLETIGASVVLESGAGETIPSARLLLAAAALANDAALESDETGERRLMGDPTEAALVAAAADAAIDKVALEADWPRVAEAPFDSDRKRMTTLHRLDRPQQTLLEPLAHDRSPQALSCAKGAIDSILEICDSALAEDAVKPLTDEMRAAIHETHDRLAGEGVRVLAAAARLWDALPADTAPADLEQGLTYLGLVGMIDPPRPEAREAVEKCTTAGIRTVMITGDHPATAAAIAKSLGVGGDGERILGRDLDSLSDEDLAEKVERIGVYARVSPEHKLRIVEALQRRGHVVAMTGDGVNDAPALKKADIGVAMGVTGTDVSKQASDIVLRDDNFATIVSAVEEGRIIFDNIRKFIKFLLSANSGELWVMLGGPLLGMPLPLLPLQILWMNLITDGPPALALGVEPAEPNLMRRAPYRPGESVFSRGVGLDIVWIGMLMGALSLGVGYRYWTLDDPKWQTVVFTTLTLSQLALAFAVRSERESLLRLGLWSNPMLPLAVAASAALQLAVVYAPPMQRIFDTRPLSVADLALCLAPSAAVFLAVEASKTLRRSVSGKRPPSG